MKKIWILCSAFALLAACNGDRGGRGKTLARLDGKSFTEGDLDLRLRSLGPDRREEVLRNPDQRRGEFERILKMRLSALGGRARYGEDETLRRRLGSVTQRVITQYYFETYLNGRGGHTLKEIDAYYRANSSRFKDDSGRVPLLAKIESRVGDSMLVAEANLDSTYRANRATYLSKAACEASIIQTAKRKEAEAALKAVQSGMKFGDAVAKYSVHGSKSNQGRIGRINRGEANYELGGTIALAESLFFEPATRLKAGQASGILPKESGFIIVHCDSCNEESLPPLDSIRSRVIDDHLRGVKAAMGQDAFPSLKVKYGVKMVNPIPTPTEKEIQEYYEKNKSGYESPETFELYHAEAAKKEQLGRFKSVRDLEGFKAAAKTSENPMTRAQDGYVGVVKRDFSLPYGIGMMPALFPALDALQEGKTGPLQSTDTRKWHMFWLAKKGPRQAKPLERVRALVKQDLMANRVTEVTPKDILATYGKGGVIRVEDVDFLREEIPPGARERYTRDNLVDYLLTWQLMTDESKALGLTREPQLMASLQDNDDNFWGRIYADSILNVSYDEDTSLLATTFREKRSLFTKDSADQDWRKHVRDLAGYITLIPADFDLEYQTYPERYRRDTVAIPFEEAGFDMLNNLRDLASRRSEEKMVARLKERFRFRLVDRTLAEDLSNPAESYKKAQNLHYDRKLDLALDLYGKLRVRYPGQKELQDSVCFGIAQIYLEQERFQQAMAEYRRVSYLYPGSANDYKAMFMVGFIQSEHLKNDSQAVRSFTDMLSKYPKTDLSDDADWMIRNIRSGGKLMPVLEGDSGWVAPDSGGV